MKIARKKVSGESRLQIGIVYFSLLYLWLSLWGNEGLKKNNVLKKRTIKFILFFNNNFGIQFSNWAYVEKYKRFLSICHSVLYCQNSGRDCVRTGTALWPDLNTLSLVSEVIALPARPQNRRVQLIEYWTNQMPRAFPWNLNILHIDLPTWPSLHWQLTSMRSVGWCALGPHWQPGTWQRLAGAAADNTAADTHSTASSSKKPDFIFRLLKHICRSEEWRGENEIRFSMKRF